MVAENPLFQGSLSWKKLQATVVNDVWPEVLFFTLIGLSKNAHPFSSSADVLLSGFCCWKVDLPRFECLKPAVDRVGYRVGFGHLFPNFVRLRKVTFLLPIPWTHSKHQPRFSEGRRFWASVLVMCRNAAQTVHGTFAGRSCLTNHHFQIWLHVPNERPHKTNPELSKPALHGIVEKKSMINLVSRAVRPSW